MGGEGGNRLQYRLLDLWDLYAGHKSQVSHRALATESQDTGAA